MDKILIVEKFHKFVPIRLNKYHSIYSYNFIFNSLKKNLKKRKIILSEDIITARMSILSRHKTSREGNNIFNVLVKKHALNAFTKIGGKVYANSVFKKLIYAEAETIFTSIMLTEKIIKKYQINGNVFLIPRTISFTVFKAMHQLGLIPKNIRVPRNILFFMRLREFLRNFYYITRFIFYPEYLLFRMKKGESSHVKKQYKIGAHLYPGIGFKTKPFSFDFFIDEKDKWKDKVIYVIDEPAPKKYVKEVKQSGYTIVDFDTDLIESSSRFMFLKSYYLNTMKIRLELFKLVFGCLFYGRTIYFTYRSVLLWNLFNDRYNVNVLFHMMHPGDLSSVVLNQKHGTNCVFIYCSTTHNRIDRGNTNKFSEEVYYSNMIFDKILSNKASNKWFKSNQNNVGDYIDIGSIMSDFVRNVDSKNIIDIKKELNISEKMTLLTFFDTVVGHIGTFTFEDQLKFFDSIYNILEENKRYFIIFKSKNKPKISSYPNEGAQVVSIYDTLKNHSRFICANTVKYNSYELMASSDLVVSAPLSSVLFEAVIGGVKSISYDPNSRYTGDHMLAEKFPNFSAHGYNELKHLIDYWLHQCNEKEFINFQNKYIKLHFDDYCDGNAIIRLKNSLNI